MTEKDGITPKKAGEIAGRIRAETAKVIVGQDLVIEEILIALLSRGHALLVGVPGLAKTLIVKTIADILALEFSRIQFTPDLMPSDVAGTDILEESPGKGRAFRFIPGPVFANVILADEINRTPPKTQAALLQAMQELQVTTGGKTYDLETPFFVLATQNPIEQEGTYPLPEAQLDRFMFEIMVGYPSQAEEMKIVKETTAGADRRIETSVSRAEIQAVQNLVRGVPAPDHVVNYAVELARNSRPGEDSAPDFIKKYVAWGAGPRASQYLVLGAKARALLHGKNAAAVEDIRELAAPVLRHRIIPGFTAEAEGITPELIIAELLKNVKAPAGRI